MLQKTVNKSGSYIPCLQENKELWDRFTLKEEYNPPFLDKYGRFPDYLSSNRNFFEPSVSRFLVENDLIQPEWPDGKQFAVCLTHDIDGIYPYRGLGTVTGSAVELIKHDSFSAMKMLFSHVNKKNSPWYNIKRILEIEKQFDATSSFYFLSCEKGDLDFNYNIEDVKDVFSDIIQSGCEIGLHGSRLAYNNSDQIKIEKKRLEKASGQDVVGYRNHYLCFKMPDTWQNLKRAGFLYDTTLGYDGVIGFRNGMCHPFKPFTLKTDKEIDIFEIPLAIMDCTLLDFMRLDLGGAWEITKSLIDTVEKYNGVLTILWHNTRLTDKNLDFYKKILGYCYKKNAWMTSGGEIRRWWNKCFYN